MYCRVNGRMSGRFAAFEAVRCSTNGGRDRVAVMRAVIVSKS